MNEVGFAIVTVIVVSVVLRQLAGLRTDLAGLEASEARGKPVEKPQAPVRVLWTMAPQPRRGGE